MAPTPYKVSTITCNGSVNVDVDTTAVFKHFNIHDNTGAEDGSFVWMEYLRESRGVYPKAKKVKEKKNYFDNQVTVLYRMGKGYFPNCKIFQNGNIQMTGIRSAADGQNVIEAIAGELKTLMQRGVVVTRKKTVDDILPCRFIIRMINTDFGFGFHIRRKNLHRLLISPAYNNACSFQPMGYPGVKLQYFWNTANSKHDGICRCEKVCFGKGSGHGDGECKKVTVAIFESGNVLITGGNDFAQVNEAYGYITGVVMTNKADVEKLLEQ
jgi:TATA-box binding protein (TBP) (component of TFIID and TFIIIB)